MVVATATTMVVGKAKLFNFDQYTSSNYSTSNKPAITDSLIISHHANGRKYLIESID